MSSPKDSSMTEIPTALLRIGQIPQVPSDVHALVQFAHTFNGYEHFGSHQQCADIANRRDHGSVDKLRACLFFEARGWRHCGEDPDEEALAYWEFLIRSIRERLAFFDCATPDWLARAIESLPSDRPVPRGTRGYNTYTTQKDHWLGWLDPAAGTGTYPRRTGANATARSVYNRIGEPEMLLWLARASGIAPERVDAATRATLAAPKLASKCKAIRALIPWRMVAEALTESLKTMEAGATEASTPRKI
jgi:hypothetical protein